MRLTELHQPLLVEGGEIFKTPDGRPRTRRIKKEEIPATLAWLEAIADVPTTNMTLGSVGRKASSGDLDIAVDANLITKDELVRTLSQWVKSQGEDPKQWIRKSGISVHFLTPIEGNAKLGYVQTDFMFANQVDWIKFGLYAAGDTSNYSGADRNLLMSSLAKAQGVKYSWQKGLVRREDDSVITQDPDEIAARLLSPSFDQTALLSVETIQAALDQLPHLKSAIKELASRLERDQTPDGEPIKPGDLRKNQEEAARIKRLIG
jgi:hypothetical protein